MKYPPQPKARPTQSFDLSAILDGSTALTEEQAEYATAAVRRHCPDDAELILAALGLVTT